MPIGASHQGFSPINQTCPVFDLGAWLYWDSRWGHSVASERGGRQVAGAGISSAFATTDKYCTWDHGKGRYIESNPLVAVKFPWDGHFQPSRDNYFRNSSPDASATRGTWVEQAGLTRLAYTVGTENHILETIAGGVPATCPCLRNTSGGDRRSFSLSSSSAAWNRSWSVLVRRVGGGTIDATICDLGVSALADPLGADISAVATTYRRIRDDGWYQLSTYIPAQALAPDVYYWINLRDGADIIYEAPQTESFGTTVPVGTDPILSAGVTVSRDPFILNMAASQAYALPSAGFLAVSITPRLDMPTFSYPSSVILRWANAATPTLDYHQIYYSNTLQCLAYQCYVGGVSQCFEQNLPADNKQGSPIGFVGSWGYRNGSPQFFTAQNGVAIEIDVTGTIPTGDSIIYVGNNSGLTSYANVNVWAVAVGHKVITRADCIRMSRWMYDRARVGTMALSGV